MSDQTPHAPNPSQERGHSAHERKPQLTSSDPYAVLGLSRSASPREVKRAYFELVRQYPPETNAETFKIIRSAYEKLQTDEARAETDLFLFQSPPAWSPRKRLRKLDLTVDAQDVEMILQAFGDLAIADFKADYRPVKI